jgi:hypothetical protein
VNANALLCAITRESPYHHSDLAGGLGAYHNQSGVPHLVNGSCHTCGKTIHLLERLQQKQPGNEDGLPLTDRSITADKPSLITKDSLRRNRFLTADEVDVAENTTIGTQALARTSSNANRDNAISGTKEMTAQMLPWQMQGAIAAIMTRYPAPNPTTRIFAKNFTAIFEQKKVANHAARIETEHLKREVAELKKELERQQNMVSKVVSEVLPATREVDKDMST